MVAPSLITKKKVQYWLDKNELSYEYLSPDWMEVNGSVDQINRLLSIQLRIFQHISSKTIVYRSLNHYQIPSSLSSSIDFISNTIRFPSCSFLFFILFLFIYIIYYLFFILFINFIYLFF